MNMMTFPAFPKEEAVTNHHVEAIKTTTTKEGADIRTTMHVVDIKQVIKTTTKAKHRKEGAKNFSKVIKTNNSNSINEEVMIIRIIEEEEEEKEEVEVVGIFSLDDMPYIIINYNSEISIYILYFIIYYYIK